MKKPLFLIIGIVFLFFYFFYTPKTIFAETCNISADGSAEPGQLLQYRVSGDILTSQEFLENKTGLGVIAYDENSKFLSCKPLYQAGGGFITTPSYGDSVVLQVIKTKAVTSLTEACGEMIEKMPCSKTVSLTGSLSTSCNASVTKGAPNDKVSINVENIGKIRPVLYIIGPTGGTLITRSISAGVTEISIGNYGWNKGNYKVEIREGETAAGKGALLTSCNFYYDGITPLDRLNAQEEVTTEDLADKINNAIPIAMGLGGIIAFILIVFGAFQIILSGGNPDRVKAGKEMITSAIAGLLLIVFSIFILKLIGQDILDIPGFGSE